MLLCRRQRPYSLVSQEQGLVVMNIYKWWDFSEIDDELKELIFVLQKKT